MSRNASSPTVNYWANGGRRRDVTPSQKAAFGRRLDRAAYWEAFVSAYLARNGFWVLHAPIVDSPVFDLTTVDLVVSDEAATWHQDLEVKGTAEHSKEELVFICSEASFRRKYGDAADRLPVPYILVDQAGDMRFFPAGTIVEPGFHYDVGRKELFPAMKAWGGFRQPIQELVTWLRALRHPAQ